MKTTLKIVIAVAILALCTGAKAQTAVKLAHIDMNALVFAMPDYEVAVAELQKYGERLEEEIESMTVELNRAYDEFQRLQEGMTDLVRQSRFEAIQSMSDRIQRFQQQAQEDFSMEQQRIMQPVFEKATRAVEAVATEQGIDYVFDAQMIRFTGRNTIDLLPSVKTHLGIRN